MIAIEVFLNDKKLEQEKQRSILRTNLIAAFYEICQTESIPGNIEEKINKSCDVVLGIIRE